MDLSSSIRLGLGNLNVLLVIFRSIGCPHLCLIAHGRHEQRAGLLGLERGEQGLAPHFTTAYFVLVILGDRYPWQPQHICSISHHK